MWGWHYYAGYSPQSYRMWGIVCKILSLPHNIVVDLNNGVKSTYNLKPNSMYPCHAFEVPKCMNVVHIFGLSFSVGFGYTWVVRLGVIRFKQQGTLMARRLQTRVWGSMHPPLGVNFGHQQIGRHVSVSIFTIHSCAPWGILKTTCVKI